jgi:hypothetical protein
MPPLSKPLDWLYSLEGRGEIYKLERMDQALALIGDPHRRLRAVHIAGTKGKGSVAAMLDAIARAARLRCGLYTKPHLVHLTERTRIDGAEMVKSSTICVSTSASGFGTSRLPGRGRAADQIAQTVGDQFSGQMMPRFIPVANPHFRIGETMQECVMRIGVALERRGQIQHVKPSTRPQFLQPLIGIEKIFHVETLRILRPPDRIRVDLGPHRRRDGEKLGAMRFDVGIYSQNQFLGHLPGIIPHGVLRSFIDDVCEAQLY